MACATPSAESASSTLSLISPRLILFVLAQRKGDVVEHVHRVEQRRHLEYHAELSALLVELDLAQRHDVEPVDDDLSSVGLFEADQLAQEHRLARAARPHDHVGEPPVDVERHPAQDRVSAVALHHVAHAHVDRVCGGVFFGARGADLAPFALATHGLPIGRSQAALPRDEAGDHVVERQDRDRALHHRAGCGLTDPRRAALGVEAVPTGDHRNGHAEHRGLDHALPEIGDIDEPAHLVDEDPAVEAEQLHAHDPGAEDAHHVEEHGQHRHHHHAGHDARHHQVLHRVDGHRDQAHRSGPTPASSRARCTSRYRRGSRPSSP